MLACPARRRRLHRRRQLQRPHRGHRHPRQRRPEGGGGIFFVVENNAGTLTIKDSRLRNNPSGEFFTVGYPGIFFHSSGHPIVTDSTIS
jgi:hypothetical protein